MKICLKFIQIYVIIQRPTFDLTWACKTLSKEFFVNVFSWFILSHFLFLAFLLKNHGAWILLNWPSQFVNIYHIIGHDNLSIKSKNIKNNEPFGTKIETFNSFYNKEVICLSVRLMPKLKVMFKPQYIYFFSTLNHQMFDFRLRRSGSW